MRSRRTDYKTGMREFLGLFILIAVVVTCLSAFVKTQNYRPTRVNVTVYNSYLKKKSTLIGSTVKGPKGIFQGDRNVLYLDCGYGYASVYICHNSNYIFKVGVFY